MHVDITPVFCRFSRFNRFTCKKQRFLIDCSQVAECIKEEKAQVTADLLTHKRASCVTLDNEDTLYGQKYVDT